MKAKPKKCTWNAPDSGLCLTTEECTESGGKPEGNCASGFGVCCFIRYFKINKSRVC